MISPHLASYEELLPYIMPAVGDVPEAIAAHAAREALIELAQQTEETYLTLTLDLQRGVPYYRLPMPQGWALEAIAAVTAEDQPLVPEEQTRGFGRGYSFLRERGVLVIEPPVRDVHRGLEVRVQALPGQDACVFPRELYDRHAELLSHGARMRLYRMRDAKWFDMSLAREEERLWRDGLRWVRVRQQRGGTTGPLIMRAPRVV